MLFSLDIEGAEFLVLQTIPWDKVDIEVSSQLISTLKFSHLNKDDIEFSTQQIELSYRNNFSWHNKNNLESFSF